MSSSQSQSNAGHPDQPGPAGNFDESYPPPPLGLDFVVPPEGGYSDQNPPPAPPPTPGMYSTSYPEDPTRDELAKCSDIIIKNSIRSDSIRRIYSYFMGLLLLVFGIYSFVVVHEPTKLFVKTNYQSLGVAVAGASIVSQIGSIICFSSGRHGSPMCSIFKFISAATGGVFLSLVLAKLPRDEILLFFGITSVLFFALTLLVFWMKLDLTRLHTVLFVGAIGLLIYGIVLICLPSYIDLFMFCPFGAILLSFYIFYDKEMMMYSKHKYSISPKENKKTD